ncbi:hypothetical protein ALC53_05689 [Atta colombica]|uniref:Uncharacterized protein n=1 Tax=Atta colombica TaxID=520822 RepID=A0A195BHS0_9HYME|nr:hypothetical protein ALC53_05689 [Atta colombica]
MRNISTDEPRATLKWGWHGVARSSALCLRVVIVQSIVLPKLAQAEPFMFKNARYFPVDSFSKMTNGRIGDPDERYGKQKRGSAGNGGAQLTKNRYISTERSAPDTRAVTIVPSQLGNMQLVSFISHIVDFEVCEYACRVAIYRLDYNIYAPCTFVLCLGASKFGASNSSKFEPRCPTKSLTKIPSDREIYDRRQRNEGQASTKLE